MSSKSCPVCQRSLPAEALAAACPRCVLALAMEPGLEDTVPLAESREASSRELEELGRLLPGLRVTKELGRGGMGAVYLGRQEKLDRLVAVKVMAPELGRDPAFQSRFTREARALARLSHPNIVAVHDFGQVGELLYLVMEYVDGPDLRRVMKTGALKPEQALGIVPEICEALCYAHENGVIHRDIKPENLLLDTKGRVKIADFGLAKLLGSETEPRLTKSGYAMGTPHYMAPEQREKPLEVDHRADIYSLGVVFYEMLTGELPQGRFAPPSSKAGVDRRLDAIVLRALEKERSKRYQSAAELKTRVDGVATAAPSRLKEEPKARGPRYAAALVLIMGLIAGVLALWPFDPSTAVDEKTRGETAARILAAAAEGDTRALAELDAGPRVEELTDEAGLSPLMIAVKRGHIEAAELLVRRAFCKIDSRGPGRNTALHYAAGSGSAAMCQALVALGADRTAVNAQGATPAYLCLTEAGGRGLECLLTEAVCKQAIPGGGTLLDAAIERGPESIDALLSAYPFDVDEARPPFSRTRLMDALFFKKFAIAAALLRGHKRPAAADKLGRTTLHYAAASGDVFILEKVLERDRAALSIADSSGATPLSLAVNRKLRLAALQLIEHGAVDVRDRFGRTAFWLACKNGDLALVGALASAETINTPNTHGATPLIAAAAAGHHEVVAALRAHEELGRVLKVDACDARGDTALLAAARAGRAAVVEELLESSPSAKASVADAGIKGREGLTALELASKLGHGETAAVIRKLTEKP